VDNQWANFPADFPEILEDFKDGDDDGAMMQEILDSVQAQPQEDLWRETVIDNNLMFGGDNNLLFGGDLLRAGDLDYPEDLGFGSHSHDFGGPAGALVTDDYLEINDLTEFEEGSEIQLRPPRSNNVMAMQQLISQGDTARRILLQRPQPFISQAESFFRTEPAVRQQQQPRVLHSSASSRDLSAFAELASSNVDLERPSEGWSINGELLDLGRDGAGVVPDQDFWSPWPNFDGAQPSSSGEDAQPGAVQSLDGSLPPEFNSASLAAEASADQWQIPDFVPPALPQDPEKPSGKLSRLNRLLPILPASAAELPSFSSTYVTASDTQVTALTITCSCSENGSKTLQAAVMNYAGGKLHQGVMTGTVKPCSEDCKQESCVQCSSKRPPHQRKVAKGSRSGFVFVFLLGVVSALIWFFLLRGTWRIAQTMFKVIL
jgi:hypothetical protein